VAQGLFGDGIVSRTLLWGVDAGLNAALSVGIPYVLTFYFLLAVLEDTGYLNSIAFLTDPFMHRLGLHGRAAIPLIAGAGCNVPAILGLRVLATMRERVLASTLICLTPCSARTAVIAGAVSKVCRVGPAVWSISSRPGSASPPAGAEPAAPGPLAGTRHGDVPLPAPLAREAAACTWYRFLTSLRGDTRGPGRQLRPGRDLRDRPPVALHRAAGALVEGWLGLPAVAGLTLIFAVLRKLALQAPGRARRRALRRGVDLGQFMDKSQLFTYALVSTSTSPAWRRWPSWRERSAGGAPG
jgi:ferrous iron transport protein B